MKKLFLFLFALFFWTGAWADKTIYLNPGAWDVAYSGYAVWVYGSTNSESDKFLPMTAVDGTTTLYKVDIPDTWTGMNLVHFDNRYAVNWDSNKWNQTAGISLSGISNNTLFTMTSQDKSNSSYNTSSFKTLYLKPNIWDVEAANSENDEVFAALVVDNGNRAFWVDLQYDGSYFYSSSLIPASYDRFTITRRKHGTTPTFTADQPGTIWNQTQDISLSSVTDNALFAISNWNGDSGKSGYSISSLLNLALYGTASASKNNDIAYRANDGAGTNADRWNTEVEGRSDDDWFQIEWASAQTFNTVKLLCENAMNAGNAPNLAFKIQTSNDGLTWTDQANVSGKNAGTGQYITVNFAEVTASYIRFQGVKQGNYGYTFYEFEVYDKEAGPISNLTLSETICPSSTTIVASPTDSEGTFVEGVTYTFSPNDGNISASGNTLSLIAGAAGEYTVTATKGDNSATATVYVINEAPPAAKTGSKNLVFYDSSTAATWDKQSSTLGEEITISGKKAKIVHLGNTCDLTISTEDKLSEFNHASIAIFPTTNFSGAITVNPGGANKFINTSFTADEWNVINFDITNTATDQVVTNIRVINNSGSVVDVLIANVVLYYKEMDIEIANSGYTTVTGTINAENKGELNDAEYANATAFDLTGATIAEGTGILTTQSANAVVIVKSTDEEKIAGTKNLCHVAGGDWIVFPKNGDEAQTITFIDNKPLFTGKIYAKDNDVTYNYSRTITGYATFSFPAAVTIPEGVVAYTYTSYEDNKVTFTRVEETTLSKNVPYVLYSASSAIISYSGSAITENGLDMREPGSTGAGIVYTANYGIKDTDGSQWILSGGVIKQANGAKIGSFRAYFTGLTAAGARAIFLDGETTKIGSINANGEINVEDGAIYNLAGQRVQNPKKGIYIINGKKVVIK